MHEIFTFDHKVKKQLKERAMLNVSIISMVNSTSLFPKAVQRMTNLCWHCGKGLLRETLSAVAEIYVFINDCNIGKDAINDSRVAGIVTNSELLSLRKVR